MAIIDNKKITIMWRLFNDAFANANTEQFVNTQYPRKLGSTISAVNNLIVNGDELKTLMPIILGVDPRSTQSNWDKLVKHYWDSLSVDVHSNGLDLEIGFVYDIKDSERKAAITELKSEVKSITDDESLMAYLKGYDEQGKPNVADNKKYKYAAPINNYDWLLYRYCVGIDGKGYKAVANKPMEGIENSPDIRFYIYDQAIADQARKKTYELNHKALMKYVEVIAKRDMVDDLLLVFKEDITGKDEMDKDMMLDVIVKSKPIEFLHAIVDDNLKIKARIEKYINANILKRIPGTSLIVDYMQSDVIIGNTLNEAVTFFSPNNTSTKTAVNEYSLKYKALNTKK